MLLVYDSLLIMCCICAIIYRSIYPIFGCDVKLESQEFLQVTHSNCSRAQQITFVFGLEWGTGKGQHYWPTVGYRERSTLLAYSGVQGKVNITGLQWGTGKGQHYWPTVGYYGENSQHYWPTVGYYGENSQHYWPTVGYYGENI